MTTNKKESGKKTLPAAKKSRKQSGGVPAALVAMLLVVALFFGGLMGFVVANKTNSYRQELAEARERITVLENTMTMMGYSEEDDPEAWIFDDTGSVDEFGDLGGSFDTPNNDVLWGDSGLSAGMIDTPAEPVVVAEFEGGQLMSDEVIGVYNEQLAGQAFSFGDVTADAGAVLDNVLRSLAGNKVLYMKAEELGLTTLTDEDLAYIRETAELQYQEQRNFYATAVNTEGMTAEEAEAAVDAYMANDLGVTVDSLAAAEQEDYWVVKLFDYVGKDVTVSEEEIQAAYDGLVAEQQALFAEYPDEFEYALMSGQTIACNAEGYRRVKHILLGFADEAAYETAWDLMDQIAQLNPETDMEQIEELNGQLDALYTDLDVQAESILQELEDGADFDALIEKYNQDEGMEQEPYRTEGYYVAADSIQWAAEFTEASMMLEEIGQVSPAVHSVGGVHIIKYVGDVTPGPVPLEQIRDEIEASVLFRKTSEAYNAQVEAWISEADIQYYPERLQ